MVAVEKTGTRRGWNFPFKKRSTEIDDQPHAVDTTHAVDTSPAVDKTPAVDTSPGNQNR